MRRFLPLATLAFLAALVATPVNAGYLIIRVLLEASTGGGTDGGSGGPGVPGGLGTRPPGRPGGGAGPGPGGPGPRPMGAGTSGIGPGSVPAPSDPSRCVVVVVPVEEPLAKSSPFYSHKKNANSETNPLWGPKLHSTYRGEKFLTNLFVDSTTIQIYENLLQSPAPTKTRATEVKDLHAKWLKSKTSEPNPKLLFNAFTIGLSIGLIDEAVAYADELLAFASEKPDGLPADIVAFNATYSKIQKDLKGSASKSNRVDYWKPKLGAINVRTSAHYTLLSWDATDAEVKRRLDFLEENFKAFYLWHATRGIVLPFPEVSLLVVLPKDPTQVLGLARALDGPPRLSSDGLYSPEHELLILSPDRLDDVGMTFMRQTQQMYQAGVSRDKLLSGDGPPISVSGQVKDGKKPEEVAKMQTTALVERLVEDSSIIGAVSREGSRQLMYATHQLPKYVNLPEWLANGSANFFTRPKEPAFILNSEGKPVMHVATVTGYGIPNYVQQRYFKDLLEKNDLNSDRGALLKSILTDAYFLGLRDQKEVHDPDPKKVDKSGVALNSGGNPANPGVGPGPGSAGPRPSMGPGTGVIPGPGPGVMPGPGPRPGQAGPMPGPGGVGLAPPKPEDDAIVIGRKKRERLTIKSQATAWALYYYLAKTKPVELQNFLNELSTMPRDIPLEGASVAAFYRAFGIDPAKEKDSLNTFAREWLDYVHDVAPAGIDITIAEPKPPSNESTSPASGPGPGQGGTGR